MATAQRCELLLFTAAFFAFAFFNQGGGWNQNARFAEVRAMVEEGTFDIDHYLVYQRDPATNELVRCPVVNAEYDWDGKKNRLCWVDMEWTFEPVGSRPLGDAVKVAMVEKCASGDIGYVEENGHFHPNKPPGTSFLGVPGYFLIYHVERMLGINPDHWRVLDTNLWLTGVFSVSLGAAIGCVLFFRLAREFAGGAIYPALWATLTLAFGTTFFPFATIYFDHALTAALLIGGLYFLRRVRETGRLATAVIAGLCGGFAVLTNYVAVGAVAILGLYALSAPAPQRWRGTIGFVLGGVGPFALLLLYGKICYGSPFRPSTDFQNPLFANTGLFLGMFSVPHSMEDFWKLFYVVKLLLYSPFRGVFWFSPVLLLGLGGLVIWLRRGRLLPEALVCAGIFLFFFAVNACFNGFHAGFTAGPRYLVPGLPFLALPLVVAFSARIWRCFGIALTVWSIGVNLLLTATDAQNPVGVGGHARVENRHRDNNYDLVREYALPLFLHGRAWPLLRQQIEVQLDKAEAEMDAEGLDAAARHERREAMRVELLAAIQRGDPSPFLLGSIEGPVSVNPIGAFEGLLTYGYFSPHTPQVEWASFNMGELLWERSRWSLLPLFLVTGGLCAWALWAARRADSASRYTPVI